MKTTIRSGVALLGLVVLAAACSAHEPASPEAQLRALFAQAEEAAERKDIAVLRRLLSERYTDALGNDRRAVEGILRVQFVRNQSIHLFTRVATIALPAPGRAQATVYVAMAGWPITKADELVRLRADLYRFVFFLEKEGRDWRVLRAEWRPAELGDFLKKEGA